MDAQLLVGFLGVFLIAGAIIYVGYTFKEMAESSLKSLKGEK